MQPEVALAGLAVTEVLNACALDPFDVVYNVPQLAPFIDFIADLIAGEEPTDTPTTTATLTPVPIVGSPLPTPTP